ncbi:MAG: CapA family protein, partial [Anaerolineales bacterium]
MSEKPYKNNPSILQLKRQLLVFIAGILPLILLFGACKSLSPAPVPTPSSTPIPSATAIPPSPTPSPTPTLISPNPPYLTWIDTDLPQHIKNSLSQIDFIALSANESASQILYTNVSGFEGGFWLYLAVAPFYSYAEDILSTDITTCWTAGWEDTMPFSRIYVSADTLETFEILWGPANEECVESINREDISQRLWVENDAISLVPFEMAEPSLKILTVDAKDPLSTEFEWDNYPLIFRLNYQVSAGFQINLDEYPLFTNYDPSKLTSIALTGVTALVRDTAYIMETQGITYPAGDIQNILSSASITHISNEVPFAEDCPSADSAQVSLRFCSDDRFIELLQAVGTDIVELSGDHFGDWGPEAMLHTLDLYKQQGWAIYGGGETLSDGLAPVFLTHNGNNFAFIGCNGKGIDIYATATYDNPGAAKCDF